jgi:hypothetical protein
LYVESTLKENSIPEKDWQILFSCAETFRLLVKRSFKKTSLN